jgi:hypothetical protein
MVQKRNGGRTVFRLENASHNPSNNRKRQKDKNKKERKREV